MPLAATVIPIGLAGAAAAGALDPPGILAWSAGVFGTLATWFPANTVILPGSLVASAGVISGFGQFTFISRDLGIRLAAAVGSVDAPGILKWTAIGEALLVHMEVFGKAAPTGFSAPPTGGPVVGVSGTVQNVDPALGGLLAAAAGSVDPPGIIGWTAIGALIVSWFTSSMTFLATPIGMVAPAAGPVTGAGSIL